MKCWYVTNMYEYVIAYVYAESCNKAKSLGLKFDPSGEAKYADIRAKRCKGLDDLEGEFELDDVDGCKVIELDNENLSNENRLIELKYAYRGDDVCYFHAEELTGDSMSDVSEETQKVFEFIKEKQEAKKAYNDDMNMQIKSGFESLAGMDGDVKGVKHAYERWLMSELEREKYDRSLYGISGQLGFEFDLKESIHKIEVKDLEEKAEQYSEAVGD